MVEPTESPPATPDEVPTGNPLEGMGVKVLFPDIEVRMVHADALSEYEIWFGFASLLGAAVISFVVAYIQSFQKDAHGVEHSNPTLLVVAIVFLLFFAAAAWRAVTQRLKIARGAQSYPMRLTADR